MIDVVSAMKKFIMISIISLTAVVAICIVGWVAVNPPNQFGLCRFAFTMYDRVPYPLSDIQIRCDGQVRTVPKTHALTQDKIRWLLDPLPEVLIISTGWEGVVKPDPKLLEIGEFSVKVLDNESAIQLFNKLKKKQERVAIHYHSTC